MRHPASILSPPVVFPSCHPLVPQLQCSPRSCYGRGLSSWLLVARSLLACRCRCRCRCRSRSMRGTASLDRTVPTGRHDSPTRTTTCRGMSSTIQPTIQLSTEQFTGAMGSASALWMGARASVQCQRRQLGCMEATHLEPDPVPQGWLPPIPVWVTTACLSEDSKPTVDVS